MFLFKESTGQGQQKSWNKLPPQLNVTEDIKQIAKFIRISVLKLPS